MFDKEMKKLAHNLVCHSCNVQPDEKVLVDFSTVNREFIRYLIEEIVSVGAHPIINQNERYFRKHILQNCGDETFSLMAKYDSYVMEDMDAVILIRGEENAFELSDVAPSKQSRFDIIYNKPVHNDRRLKKKWVLLRFPTPAFAQSSQMSTEQFENYFYTVCNLDYRQMGQDMLPLKNLMEKTDKVRIVAPETDLTFSIKNIPAVICAGECNIPDGEIYTAPIKNSINGTIKFNVNMAINGVFYNELKLAFKDGKVVECNSREFEKVMDTDDGGRYVGEFAFGVNPLVTRPIMDILFDEKMTKSIHMAMGACYEDAPNGNKSAIHVDLIQSHAPEYGGGEIYFDGKLIRKNGEFVYE